MSDKDDPLSELGDVDWDSALDEWEKSSFVAEVAKDAESPVETAPRRDPPSSAPLKSATAHGTLIAPVPRELRGLTPPPPRNPTSPSGPPRPPAPPRRSPPPPPLASPPRVGPPRPGTKGGGLGQLFSRAPVPPPNSLTPPPKPASLDALLDVEEEVTRVGGPIPGTDEVEPFAPKASGAPSETIIALPTSAALAASQRTDEVPAFSAATAETRVVAQAPALEDAVTQTRHPAAADDDDDDADTAAAAPAAPAAAPAADDDDDDEPTIGRASVQPSAAASAPRPSAFDDELHVSKWLDPHSTAAYQQRAIWLEEEAREENDPTKRARLLLVASELRALVGDPDHASELANEARDTVPALALAWRQARQLAERDSGALVSALDAEAHGSPTSAARAHATLLAADVMRATVDLDGAFPRWENARKLDPADARAPVALATMALANGDLTSSALALAGNSELVALDRAIGVTLRLRGAPRPGDDNESRVSDGLRKTRHALVAGDVSAAAQALSEMGGANDLGKGALWLSAAFGATHIASRRSATKTLKILAQEGEDLAKTQLAARGIELGDPELVAAALEGETPLDIPDQAAVLALSAEDALSVVGALADREELAPFLDALSVTSPSSDVAERAARAAGSPDARALAALGRHLAGLAAQELVETSLTALAPPRPPSAAGVALEAAIRGRRWKEIIDTLSALPSDGPFKHVAAALVAERAKIPDEARRAWREALGEGRTNESLVRIVASFDGDVDLADKLREIADDLPDGLTSALLRIEAVARKATLEDEEVLDRAHRSAPSLCIAAFLAERLARRRGDVDGVLRWIAERRAFATDAFETTLEAVREALLVADRDPGLASERLGEAHQLRPDDAALRELYERLATEPPTDRGAWREKRAEKLEGPAQAQLFTEAAYEHERAGDAAAALRCAEKAAASDERDLPSLVLLRAEIETGKTERQTEELLALAKTTEDSTARREAYERLAEIDEHGKKDRGSALLWHRAILDDAPSHKPSLRWVEHALIGDGNREDDLAPILEAIVRTLDGTTGGEVTGHAQLYARLALRPEGTPWDRVADVVRIAANQPEPSVWSLRTRNGIARLQKDDVAILSTTLQLLERTQRSAERSTLLVRASEAAARLARGDEALAHLEQAANEDPGDVVTWGLLAESRQRGNDMRGAAEACESLARASIVRAHQLVAWSDASKIWLEDVKDRDRATAALEQAAEIDVGYGDVFQRLSAVYLERRLDAELAALLERRLDKCTDDGERIVLEVDLARALADIGEVDRAKTTLKNALEQQPDHTTALSAMADLCVKEADFAGAEQAYVRLARLLATPEEQSAVFDKLGDIYAGPALNLSRAEVAFKEVVKRAPKDVSALSKLVDVYKRQKDAPNAVEIQTRIVAEAANQDERLTRLIELAAIHETVARDARKAEQTLDSARKEYPTSVVALRALAEFYARQKHMPAMQILLDRAAADARRSFAAGRFVPALFQVLLAAYELRGKKDAARLVAATLAAVEGNASELRGADAQAMDPRVDDVLAPETVNASLRTLLYSLGDALDTASPMDLRAVAAAPLVPGSPIGPAVGATATVVGLGALQILVSPKIGRNVIPLSSNPPTVLVGEELGRVKNTRARTFLVVRALKMILARASALIRNDAKDVATLATGLFMSLNPMFQPQGVDVSAARQWGQRIHPALPRTLDPTASVLALEAAGMLGPNIQALGVGAQTWANRAALLAIGDPNGALDAIAWLMGEEGAPTGSESRAAWIARTPAARDLMTYSVSDGYAEARMRLGLDRAP